MKSHCLNYRELPGHNSLFLAYLYDYLQVQEFFPCYPRSRDELLRRVEKVIRMPRYPRKPLVALLQAFNQAVGGGPEAQDNLKRLCCGDSVAVVAGQQVGFLGGPGYAAYKAVTAIALSNHLRNLGANAVPVFWMASDDSDFDEVSSTHFVDSHGRLFSAGMPDRRRRLEQMAGTADLPGVQEVIAGIDKRLGGGTLTPPVSQYVGSNYTPQRTFREAFALWLNGLFGKHGLIIFDPLIEGYRSHLKDFYIHAVRNRDWIVRAVDRRSEELESRGFPVQVKTDGLESFLFLVEDQSRFKLEVENGHYRLKGRRKSRFTEDELVRDIESDRVVLGPNVLLRPVLQDYLFPTAIAVAGPSEVAYYAQVSAIAPFWNMEMAVYPRSGFTIVDQKSQRLMMKYGLDIRTILRSSPRELAETVLRGTEFGEVLAVVDTIKSGLGVSLTRLRELIEKQDPTVAEMLVKAQRKVFYQLQKVNNRFIENRRLSEEKLQRHLDHLESHLIPNGVPQERVLNFNYLLSRTGPSLVDSLIETVDPTCLGHQIVMV